MFKKISVFMLILFLDILFFNINKNYFNVIFMIKNKKMQGLMLCCFFVLTAENYTVRFVNFVFGRFLMIHESGYPSRGRIDV